MSMTRRRLGSVRGALTAAAGICCLGVGLAYADEIKVTLTGDQEVPSVVTSARATGTITVSDHKSVSGTITTTGIDGTMAHIHLGAIGKSGPPVITLTKTSEYVWSVPAGAKLTDEQYESYKAGNLYINVHSAAHKPGEIRAQLKP
jgi:hypothetical protein